MSFVLAFISSFSWSVFDVSRKKLIGYFSELKILLFLSIIQALFFYLLIFFKGEELLIPQQYFGEFIGSIAFVLIGNIAFLKAIKLSEISSAVPFLSFVPVFSIILSIFILDEWLSLKQIIGCLVIVVSSFFVHSSKKNLLHLEKGSWYMIFASLCWASASTANKLVLTEISKFIYAFEQSLVIACVLLAYFLIMSPKELLVKWTRPKIFFLFLAVLSSMIAIFFQLWSIEILFVGVFESFKRATSLFFTLLFAKIFFKENIGRKKIISIIIMIMGVFFISI